MTEEAIPVETPEEASELVYRWTIRALYLLAIGINVALLWGQAKNDPEVQIKIAQAKAWWAKRTEGCEGCKRRRAWLNRQIWNVHQEAEQIVNEGAESGT